MTPEEKAAVFKIRLEGGHPDRNKNGTGFLVAERLVLTAYHVVTPGKDRLKPVARRGEIYIDLDPETAILAELVEWDARADWALLHCGGIPDSIRPLPLRDPRGLKKDEPNWESWGYPAKAPDGFTPGGVWRDRRGPAEAPTAIQLDYDHAKTSKPLEPNGFSGSPMVVKGCAVGILQAKQQDDAGEIEGATVYATPVSQFLDHVDVAKVSDVGARLPVPRTRFDSPGASAIEKRNRSLIDWIDKRQDPADRYGDGGRLQLRLSFCDDFDALVEGNLKGGGLTPNQILPPARSPEIRDLSDCVLLQAAGGAGKTVFLCELARAAFRADIHVFLLNLAKLRAVGPEDVDPETLFQRCSEVGFYDDFGKAKNSELPVLLLVDGLNEIANEVSEEALQQCERLARDPSVQMLVADRIHRRQKAEGFSRATLEPLTVAQIRRALGRPEAEPGEHDKAGWDLLSTPFFLDLYRSLLGEAREKAPGLPPIRRQAMFREYFKNVLQLERLASLAYGACRAYETFQSPEFEEERWVEWLRSNPNGGPTPADMPDLHAILRSAGVVVQRGRGRWAFRHQLLHDYLAGLHVAVSDWNHRLFDGVTFSANSPEPLLFCAEHLAAMEAEPPDVRGGSEEEEGEQRNLDRFVLQLFDWNVQVALQCIGEAFGRAKSAGSGGDRTAAAVPRDRARAIAALEALRIHGRVQAAAKAAREKLSRMAWAEAQRFASAETVEQLQEVVRETEFSPEYSAWKGLFLAKIGSQATEEQIACLAADPLLGWTASNVLRRLNLSDVGQGQIRILYRVLSDPESDSTRWRIVHALGTHESAENVKLLMEAAEADPYHWVVYGATRSLIEIASKPDSPSRQAVLDWLDRQLTPEANRLLTRAFRWAAVVEDADRDWLEAIGRLLEKCRGFTRLAAEKRDLEDARRRLEEARRGLETPSPGPP